ncbi:hypothetical protein ACMU_12520 [Actibacterium mucosum KCTC 23349]|uniref:Urease accessory protein UreD n=1 Tax=Actibacterium mucosum KCTC 23349 TaxID=1454373 RepID=A0A037ZL16_9RHOB|nr:urease accessory protein UreD [Actibacterium mucosum]KAJ55511.1 hypothetical protein ACMU_12520 [Actibacterium mucosum KCTC 23349]
MFDTVPDPQHMQRTRGRASVVLRAAPGGARLNKLHQSGSAKAMLPKVHSKSPEVVFLNTAGGLTGGDRMAFSVTLDDGAKATATTQTAERAYASVGNHAALSVHLTIGQEGALDWLPQETILFEHSNLRRETRIDMAGDARLLMCETVVLGRVAMGETLHTAQLLDRRVVTRAGIPALIEPFRIDATTLAEPNATAGLKGARALSTIALIAPGAEDALGPLRAAFANTPDVHAAASAWDGKCIARLMAVDPAPLRHALARAIETLRGGPLPRVWQI